MLHGCRDGYYSTSLQLEGIQCFSSRIFQQRRHLPQQGLLRLKGCLLTAALILEEHYRTCENSNCC